MGPLRPYFPKLTSSSENRRQGGKKAGRGGWGKARKHEGGVGGVSDDVIEKNKKKIKNQNNKKIKK